MIEAFYWAGVTLALMAFTGWFWHRAGYDEGRRAGRDEARMERIR